jgi:SAM-dependent methyltransferase
MRETDCFDNRVLYEQEAHWDREYDAKFYMKKRILQSLIEPEVETILDVGCGNGAISNDFCSGRKVVACDRSEAALAHVSTDKVVASCDNLPFGDQSFDYVLCSEVIEHLPEDIFENTLKELSRVTRKLLVLTVPNREVRFERMTRCACCHARYHMFGHLRSFRKPQDISARFSDFEIDFVGYCGHERPAACGPLIRLQRLLLGDWPGHEVMICPRCGSKAAARNLRPSGTLRRLIEILGWFTDRAQWRFTPRPVLSWMVLRLARKRVK